MEQEPRIAQGEVCAKCKRAFAAAHGRPVLCYLCFEEQVGKGKKPEVPKAWHELEI